MERFLSSEASSENSFFERQFKDPRQVRLPSGTAEVADLTPEKMRDEVPVLLAQGWGLGLETYKPAMEQLFNDERHVVSIAHPRVGGALGSSMNVPELSIDPKRSQDKRFFDEYPEAELRKALNTLEVLEELGIEKVDAIAHSEGAMNISIAAMMYPEKFRSIVFFGPAGMMDKESWPRLAKGFAAQGTRPEAIKDIPITESERAVGKAAVEDLKKYFFENPERAISEVAAMVNRNTQTKDLLPYLHDLGINIAVMSAESDPVFPQTEVRKAAETDAVDAFISVPGGHGMIGDHPEIVMPIAEGIFEEFATREKTPEQKKMLAEREYQSGVRYIPGEGLVISEYVKKGQPRKDSGA
jgi:pimeloyl-ACP methyl ester carboxylesterase